MIALKMAGDLFSSKMIVFSKVEDLVFDRLGNSNSYVFRTRFGMDEGLGEEALISAFPTIEYLSGNLKIPACLGDISGFISIPENLKLPMNISFGLNGHLDLLSTETSSILSTEAKNSRSSYITNNGDIALRH
jgi:hypothetical protein